MKIFKTTAMLPVLLLATACGASGGGGGSEVAPAEIGPNGEVIYQNETSCVSGQKEMWGEQFEQKLASLDLEATGSRCLSVIETLNTFGGAAYKVVSQEPEALDQLVKIKKTLPEVFAAITDSFGYLPVLWEKGGAHTTYTGSDGRETKFAKSHPLRTLSAVVEWRAKTFLEGMDENANLIRIDAPVYRQDICVEKFVNRIKECGASISSCDAEFLFYSLERQCLFALYPENKATTVDEYVAEISTWVGFSSSAKNKVLRETSSFVERSIFDMSLDFSASGQIQTYEIIRDNPKLQTSQVEQACAPGDSDFDINCLQGLL